MPQSALRIASIAAFVLFRASAAVNLVPLEEYFDVQKGTGPWSCNTHFDLLEKMFKEIQEVNNDAIAQLQTDKYNDDDETRKLARSMFGISPSAGGKEPGAGPDLQKLAKVRRWYDELKEDIDRQKYKSEASKVQLYCDSNFMDAKLLTDRSPSEPSETVRDTLRRMDLELNAQNSWIYHIPTQNELGGGAWLLLPKEMWEEFPRDDTTGKPSYCAQANTYGWTLEDDAVQRSQPIIILCPSSFTKSNVEGGDIPEQLDLAAQETGKVLDTMEPRWLTLYHELFHVTQEPNIRGTDQAPDADYRPAKKGVNGRPVPSWPAKKGGFDSSKTKKTYGAIECMYTALFDLAEPVVKSLPFMQATKNPESYAWFGAASYLSAHGASQQDWSSGACRDRGSPAQTVTVTREPNIPRQTAGWVPDRKVRLL